MAGLCCATAVEFAGLFAGLICVIAVEFAGLFAGLVAGCVVSVSRGIGARVSEGSALEATGISTLGEFVVTGPGVFSFFARTCGAGGTCGAVSAGCFADLFNATAGGGIGLGSINGAVSTLATSFEGVTGAAAMLFCCSQPRS